MQNMNTKSIFQNIADEIFGDKFCRDHDVAAASRFFNSLISAEKWGVISYEQSNFFIAQETDDMDRITKLATMLPTKLTLTNTRSIVTQIDHGVEYNKKIKGHVEWESYGFFPSGDFRSWFQGALPLLNAGIINYYPNTVDFIIYPDGKEEKDISSTVSIADTCVWSGQIKNKEYQLSKISTLEIPYLYDVSLSDFGEISVENVDILKNFRQFFAKTITEIDFQKEKEVAEFQYDLSRNVRNIETAYKKEALKLAGSLTLGTLATVGASLFLFYDLNALYGTILGIAEGGGVVQAIQNIFAYQIEKVTLKNEDCYFLWLLHR